MKTIKKKIIIEIDSATEYQSEILENYLLCTLKVLSSWYKGSKVEYEIKDLNPNKPKGKSQNEGI